MMDTIASISFSKQNLEVVKQKMRGNFNSNKLLQENVSDNSKQMPKDEVTISDAARRRYEQFSQGFWMHTMDELSEYTGYSVEDIRRWRTSLSAFSQELRAQKVAEFEGRPIELRMFSWGSHNLHDIIRGIEINDTDITRELGHRLFRDIKDAPLELKIANSLAHHISAFHLIDEGASHEEVTMFREAAMRMALYFAENHLDNRNSSLFMAEMRAMKEIAIRMTQDTGSALLPLRVSDVREGHRMYMGDSQTQMASFVTGSVRTPEVMEVAANFDTWIEEDRFSSVRDWMERIKTDIARV